MLDSARYHDLTCNIGKINVTIKCKVQKVSGLVCLNIKISYYFFDNRGIVRELHSVSNYYLLALLFQIIFLNNLKKIYELFIKQIHFINREYFMCFFVEILVLLMKGKDPISWLCRFNVASRDFLAMLIYLLDSKYLTP